MSTGPSSELRDAYERTHYRVRPPRGGVATIRIGKPLPAPLPDLLPHADAPWAFVTAWNPWSGKLPREVNHDRQRELLTVLQGESTATVIRAGVGVSEDTRWRESSLFVVGIACSRLKPLMHPFDQNAMVCGHGNDVARLVWLR